MKRGSTIVLQAVVVLIGIAVLAFMLWEPHVDGRNVHATLFEIYFNDLFLAYAYLSSIPFFMALYQAFTLLGQIGQNKTVLQDQLKALRTIKYCGLALVVLVFAPLACLFIFRPGDDIAGGVAIGLFLLLVSAAIAAAAGFYERRLRGAADVKSE